MHANMQYKYVMHVCIYLHFVYRVQSSVKLFIDKMQTNNFNDEVSSLYGVEKSKLDQSVTSNRSIINNQFVNFTM